MSGSGLSAKEAYFEEQALLDISDDEQELARAGFDVVGCALAGSKAMPPPTLRRERSSFLGPTPKERQAEFEAHATKHRVGTRHFDEKLARSPTAPEGDATRSFPTLISQNGQSSSAESAGRLKRVSSLPNMTRLDQSPFYKQVGDIPRELRHGKNVKLAENIKLEPEHKQILKGKVVYFYPNDDVSMPRRMRIHKVIQLGAAWVKRWRDDITHILLDDASHTYSQLLRHLNQAGFSCIEFGKLLDHTAIRFAIKGAPRGIQSNPATSLLQSPKRSQNSLNVKPSRRRIQSQEAQNTDSPIIKESLVPGSLTLEAPLSSSDDAIVIDSFIMPSSGPVGRRDEPTEIATNFDDALTQAIKETIALAHLPLDEDDDADSPPPTPMGDEEEGTDEEVAETAPKAGKMFKLVSKPSAIRDKSLNMNTFQCMNSGSGYSQQNPNARTIQVLSDMCKYYDQMQDHWRTLAYRKGITTLKKQTVKITTARQAAALPFIGQRLANKIEEIVVTDRLQKLDNTRDDPLDSVLRLFLGIYGAGLIQANKWIQCGHRTLSDLKTKAKLTNNHKIGIDHYEDFNSRISRPEVEAHGAIVRKALRGINKNFDAIVMGSYRRGAMDSGDIDIIITCPGASLTTLYTVVFDTLISQLFDTGFLKASLTTSHSYDMSSTKWHGASCLPGSIIWRRMDLLLVPDDEMGAALLYFTGNDIFNRSMRLLARKKNMGLNQRGLYKDVKRGSRGEKLSEGILVEGRSEKKIFEVLGVPWREPHERIC
ncbi:hypothetical protein GQ44DRAFT_746407 [Phaeosphaeriaceae sp. PMI808]|nr:hypothetical protein GQ44DRAFT_746407 [Phaeosphaeriaceae sp. PMI808]